MRHLHHLNVQVLKPKGSSISCLCRCSFFHSPGASLCDDACDTKDSRESEGVDLVTAGQSGACGRTALDSLFV